jgi:hypothetical protein
MRVRGDDKVKHGITAGTSPEVVDGVEDRQRVGVQEGNKAVGGGGRPDVFAELGMTGVEVPNHQEREGERGNTIQVREHLIAHVCRCLRLDVHRTEVEDEPVDTDLTKQGHTAVLAFELGKATEIAVLGGGVGVVDDARGRGREGQGVGDEVGQLRGIGVYSDLRLDEREKAGGGKSVEDGGDIVFL